MESATICCFGEVLWDQFPSGKKLGGAPFNVASSLHGLGASVQFISSIGIDSLGDEILSLMKAQQLSTQFIQRHPNYPTGQVHVQLDDQGVAQYEIAENAAWDFIKATPEATAQVAKAQAFIFGSLSARGASKKALDAFLKAAQFSVFDVNLRPPFYSISLLIELMQQASVLKFNDTELYLIAEQMGSPYHSMDQHIAYIAQQTGVSIICVTKGAFGAVLYHNGKWFYNSGYKIKVVDTVGAGDSFLATLIQGLIHAQDIQNTLNKACAMGALVAGSSGANPEITEDALLSFMNGDKTL